MLSAQRPIEARAPGRRHDLRLLVLGLMRPGEYQDAVYKTIHLKRQNTLARKQCDSVFETVWQCVPLKTPLFVKAEKVTSPLWHFYIIIISTVTIIVNFELCKSFTANNLTMSYDA